MSVTIKLDLPEAVVEQATKMGLLDSQAIAGWLAGEVNRRNAALELKKTLDRLREVVGTSLSSEEINSEIKAARSERRAREARR